MNICSSKVSASTTLGTVFVHLTTFNGAQWVDQAIQSLLSQTHSDLVLNISDNASTDNTVERIKAWAKRDSRVRFFVHETNRGAYFNWMCGLEQAKTFPYFMWACQDDFWAHDWIEQCVGKINKHKVLAACGQVVAVDTTGQTIPTYGLNRKSHRYMRSRSKWIRLARYALDPEEYGKSGRILAVFRTTDLLNVVFWPNESLDVPVRTGDLLMMRRILATGPIYTIPNTSLFKRIGSTSLDFPENSPETANVPRSWLNKANAFVRHTINEQRSWYRLYASDSSPLHMYERIMIMIKAVRVIGRRVSEMIRAEARQRLMVLDNQ